MLPCALNHQVGTSVNRNPGVGLAVVANAIRRAGAGGKGNVVGDNPCAEVVIRTLAISHPVEVDSVLLGGLKVIESGIGEDGTIATRIVGVGGATVVADIQCTAVARSIGCRTDGPLVVMRAVHQAPVLVVNIGCRETGAVRQGGVLVFGSEAHGLRPAAVAVVTGAAHHSFIIICSVGCEVGEVGGVVGRGGHRVLVELLAADPVAEGIGRGGAILTVGHGADGGRGGSHIGGRLQGGQTAGRQSAEGEAHPVATLDALAVDRTNPEEVIVISNELVLTKVRHIDRIAGSSALCCRVVFGAGDHIAPASLHIAGQPTDIDTVCSDIGDTDIGHIPACIGILIEA